MSQGSQESEARWTARDAEHREMDRQEEAKHLAAIEARGITAPARAGDVVPCLVCAGKGYVHSLVHVVCRVCKGTRIVTIEAYK